MVKDFDAVDLLMHKLNFFSNLPAFICHEQGATGILYAPMHQILISGGKKGVVCIWDVRQRQLRHTFQATHHSHIKCLALDPNEEFFVTGSADGDIKVRSAYKMR